MFFKASYTGALFCVKFKSITTLSVYVHAAVYLDHLTAQTICYVKPLLRRKLIYVLLEKIILQVDILNEKLGMENVRLVNVDVYCVIFSQRIFIYIILNRSYLVIDKNFFPKTSRVKPLTR